jgi:competence protein ComFB
MDMMAIALNHLPPRYIVTERGGLYSKLKELEFQFEVDVQTEIVKAALIVGNNNRHQDNEL